MSSDWIIATGLTLITLMAVLFFSKWLERKNYAQQQELLRRKKERLQNTSASESLERKEDAN